MIETFKLIIKVEREVLYFTAHNYKESGNHIQFTDKFNRQFEYHKDCLIKKELKTEEPKWQE